MPGRRRAGGGLIGDPEAGSHLGGEARSVGIEPATGDALFHQHEVPAKRKGGKPAANSLICRCGCSRLANMVVPSSAAAARGSCAWPEPEGDESPGLAGQPFILSRVDGSGLGHWARFCQPLDEEPGREDFLAGPLQRRQPVSHRPARAPGLLDGPDVEVATPVTQPVPFGCRRDSTGAPSGRRTRRSSLSAATRSSTYSIARRACPPHLPAAPGRPAGHSRRYRTRPGHGRETRQRIHRIEVHALPLRPCCLLFVPAQMAATTLRSRITDSHSHAVSGACCSFRTKGGARSGHDDLHRPGLRTLRSSWAVH